MKRLGLLAAALLLLLLAAPAAHAQTFDAQCSGRSFFSTTVDCTLTVGTGSNRALLIGVHADSGDHTVSALTVGGSAAGVTSLGTAGTGPKGFAYYKLAPASGSQTVAVTLSGAPSGLTLTVRSYSNVAQSSTFGTPATATGASTSASVNVSTTAGQKVVDFVTWQSVEGQRTATVGANQTQHVNDPAGNAGGAGSEETATGATTTMSWTFSQAVEWCTIAVRMSAATGGGSGDTTPPSTIADLAANATTSKNIGLTWTVSTDANGISLYQIDRCQGGGCTSWVQIDTSLTNAYQDTNLTPNTLYRYRVRGVDPSNNISGNSNIAEATTPATRTGTLLWTPTAPLTQDGFVIRGCTTTETTCVPSQIIGTAAAGATSFEDTASGLPRSCYNVQATLSGTGGSGISSTGCTPDSTVTQFTLTIAHAGTGTGTTTPPVGTSSHADGTVVDLTATSAANSDFMPGAPAGVASEAP